MAKTPGPLPRWPTAKVAYIMLTRNSKILKGRIEGCPVTACRKQHRSELEVPLGHWRVRTVISFDVFVDTKMCNTLESIALYGDRPGVMASGRCITDRS